MLFGVNWWNRLRRGITWSKEIGHALQDYREGMPVLFERKIKSGSLEPAFLILDVRSDKLLVRFREIDDALNETNDPADSAGYYPDHELNDSFGRIAEDELMNSETAQ